MALNFIRSATSIRNPGLVVVVSFAHGFNEFFGIIIPPLFPFLIPRLSITYSQASLLVSVFFLTYSICQLPVGPIADGYDNRNLLVGGMLVLSLGIALVGVAASFKGMLAGMIIAGIGGSSYHPTGMALISDVEPDSTYGRSMGIHGMLGSLGTVAAPLLVVLIAEKVGWRAALLTGSTLGVIFSIVLYLVYPKVLPNTVNQPSNSFTKAVNRTFGGTLDVSKQLLRTIEYLRTPRIFALSLLFIVVGAEVRAVQTFTPSFAVEMTGLGEGFGGLMLSITMVTASIASMLAGTAVDRFDRMLVAGGSFVGTAFVVIGLVVFPLPPVRLAVGLTILGAVLYSIYPAANAVVASVSADEESGSLFAVTNTAAAVGGAIGPYLLGVVASLSSVRWAFLTTVGIACCGFLVVLGSQTVLDS